MQITLKELELAVAFAKIHGEGKFKVITIENRERVAGLYTPIYVHNDTLELEITDIESI